MGKDLKLQKLRSFLQQEFEDFYDVQSERYSFVTDS